MSSHTSNSARVPQLLPGLWGASLSFLLAGVATGVARWSSTATGSLAEMLPVILWALTAGGMAAGLVYLLTLLVGSLLPPNPQAVLAVAQARYGMRMVRDDPGQAYERQSARWREQLGDRAALLALLAALVAGGWLLCFVLQVPRAGDPAEQETNAWLLFWGLASSGALLTLSGLIAALGTVWCRRVSPPAIGSTQEAVAISAAHETYAVERPRSAPPTASVPMAPLATVVPERPVNPPSQPPAYPTNPSSGGSAPAKATNDDYPDWPEND